MALGGTSCLREAVMKRSIVCFKCAWCGRVKSRAQWVFERRSDWSRYRLATCPHCRVLYALAGSSQLRIQ